MLGPVHFSAHALAACVAVMGGVMVIISWVCVAGLPSRAGVVSPRAGRARKSWSHWDTESCFTCQPFVVVQTTSRAWKKRRRVWRLLFLGRVPADRHSRNQDQHRNVGRGAVLVQWTPRLMTPTAPRTTPEGCTPRCGPRPRLRPSSFALPFRADQRNQGGSVGERAQGEACSARVVVWDRLRDPGLLGSCDAPPRPGGAVRGG